MTSTARVPISHSRARTTGDLGAGLVGAWSSRDVADVELVPVSVGEEVQAGSSAGYLGAGREWLPVREHDPVFAARAGVTGGELGHGEPVTVWAVAAEQRDAGACHGQGPGAFDLVVPAGHGVLADAHDREITVVAGPGAGVVDVEGGAVADRLPRADLGVPGVVPGGFQCGGEPDDPVRADRLLGVRLAPAVVAVDSLVEVSGPDLVLAAYLSAHRTWSPAALFARLWLSRSVTDPVGLTVAKPFRTLPTRCF